MKNFKLVINNYEREITQQKFPGGESLIRIECDPGLLNVGFDKNLYGMITMNFKSNSDLFDLMLLVDAVHRHFTHKVVLSLNMDYLPYARQDRVCNPGESLSVKVVADLINSLGFDNVYCKDIHSNVGVALINNLKHIEQHVCAYRLYQKFKPFDTCLVSPDAGAMKKTMTFAKAYGFDKVICAEKERDVLTGDIKGIKLNAEVAGLSDVRNYLVLDDICDGGRTFIELAKVIKPLTSVGDKLYLYVTHGIFSNGTEELAHYYNGIYVSNLMSGYVEEQVHHSTSRVEVI